MSTVVAVETVAPTTATAKSAHTAGTPQGRRQTSMSSVSMPPFSPSPADQNQSPSRPPLPRQQSMPAVVEQQPTEWGRNFWVTLVDPGTGAQFYACPSTGETTWDAPVGNFVLPPSAEGEWWELLDETHGGIPYYYHTKSGETTWDKPNAFVIPLGVIQNTSLGRRLSQSTRRHSRLFPDQDGTEAAPQQQLQQQSSQVLVKSRGSLRRAVSSTREPPSPISERTEERTGSGSRSGSGIESYKEDRRTPTKGKDKEHSRKVTPPRDRHASPPSALSTPNGLGSHPPSRTRTKSSPHLGSSPSKNSQSLTAAVEYIAGRGSPSPSKEKDSPVDLKSVRRDMSRERQKEYWEREQRRERERVTSNPTPPRSVSSPVVSPANGHTRAKHAPATTSMPKSPPPELPTLNFGGGATLLPLDEAASLVGQAGPSRSPVLGKNEPRRSPFSTPPSLVMAATVANGTATAHAGGGKWKTRPRRNTAAGEKGAVNISGPVLDVEATKAMNPLNQSGGDSTARGRVATKRLSTGDHPTLPRDLVFEIQQFAQSDFARRYFATHKEGLIFKRRVPMERMMTWQKQPLTSSLLLLNKSLHKDAVKAFKTIQRVMGDRDRDTSSSHHHTPQKVPPHLRHADSSNSLHSLSASTLLEEERWLLGEGITKGEMRDEIYGQLVKQLNGNPNMESLFRGWQLMCVLVVCFPPSRGFEPYVKGFMTQRAGNAGKAVANPFGPNGAEAEVQREREGRIDVMARYCLGRLDAISKKGPRGKPPTVAEIEIASDAAFNPSTFGESLDSIFRLQQRTYPSLKIPIILPFLADGILALGGTKCEGIFRVPGDADVVSELRLRIDKGVYTLEGIDDPHVLGSLLKLWLRELRDPVIPDELYEACIECSTDPAQVIAIVSRLPWLHRRVLLFVVSFLQLFLDERVVSITKMGVENLALLMAPNLLRCRSDDVGDVFKNTQFEQNFVYNLLLHLRCDKADPDYIPEHGKGAVATPNSGRKSHQKSRRPKP